MCSEKIADQSGLKAPVPFMSRLTAGVVGASAESVFRQPLTAIQTYAITQNSTAWEATRKIYELGGMGKFYDGAQGFAISYGTRLVQRTGMFTINDVMREKNYSSPKIIPVITGYEVAINSVSEISMTLAQAQTDKHKVASPIQLFKEHVKQHGVKTVLGTGAKAILARNSTFNSVYFGVGNALPEYKRDHPLGTGMLSGVSAAVVSHPCEVVRARQVLSPLKSVRDVVAETLAQEGWKGLTRGMSARVAGIGAGAGICFAAYNKVLGSSSAGPAPDRFTARITAERNNSAHAAHKR